MRSLRTAVVAAFVAAIVGSSATLARAEDAPAVKDAWASFKPGSSVTMRSVTRMGGDAGDQPPQESRMTLVSVSDKEYVLKSEAKIQGEWLGQDVTTPRTAAAPVAEPDKTAKPEDLGEDKLTIEGQEYVCKKQKSLANGTTTISWVYKDTEVLKTQSTGPGEAKSTSEVTALRKKLKVAGKDLTCRETKSTSKSETSETTTVWVTSEEVPGFTVRTEMTMRAPGMMMTTVTDVTAFEVK